MYCTTLHTDGSSCANCMPGFTEVPVPTTMSERGRPIITTGMNKCQAKNCKTLATDGSCTDCNDGYELKNKICIAQNCETAFEGECTKCDNGFQRVGNICKAYWCKSTEYLTGTQLNTSGFQCKVNGCYLGYRWFAGGVCKAENCATNQLDTDFSCKRCASGYKTKNVASPAYDYCIAA